MMSDDELQAEVLDELRAEPAARRSKIDVNTRDGTVTVSGEVACFLDKQKIDLAVTRVIGIEAFDTQISVNRRSGIFRQLSRS